MRFRPTSGFVFSAIFALTFSSFLATPSRSADFDDVLQVLGGFKSGVGGDITGDQLTNYLDVFQIALEWRRFVTTLVSTDPLNRETDVAVTRETILEFDKPIDPDTVDDLSIFAKFADAVLPALRHVSPDRKKVTLFYVDPLPQRARIRIIVNGDVLLDENGLPVDADRDGEVGGVGAVDFDTLGLTTLAGTAVCGRVFASELVTAKGTTQELNVPLEGVTIRVDGIGLTAVTDRLGDFRLEPAPVGKFFVHIDGHTVASASIDGVSVVTQFPEGPFYPSVGKPFVSVASRETNVGNIYLPLVLEGALQAVSATQQTEVELPGAILADRPEVAGLSIRVATDSLYADDLTRGGMVGLGVVEPDRLPGQLPEGLEFPIVITVQTDGPTNFDVPAPACFPNLPDPITGEPLPAGTESSLYSFNHDKGVWEAVGSMSVSEDGALVCTDPGVGIRAPGWHGVGPASVDGGGCDGCCLSNGAAGGAGGGGDGAGGGGDGGGPGPVDSDIKGFADPLPPVVKKDNGALTLNIVCFNPSCDADKFSDCENAVRFLAIKREKWCEKTAFKYAKKLGIPLYKWVDICEAKWKQAKDFDDFRCDLAFNQCSKNTEGSRLVKGADPIQEEIDQILDQIIGLVEPFGFGEEIPQNIHDQVDALLAQADAAAGGDVDAYLEEQILNAENERASQNLVEVVGNPPPYPIDYLAQFVLEDGEIFEIRGRTQSFGQYTLFPPRNSEILQVAFYDRLTDRVGIINPFLDPERSLVLPPIPLRSVPEGLDDVDLDDLEDIVELILGTDPENPDTDGDGIFDGAEVAQGLNPLDGLLIQTGIIATADTPGSAVDIQAVDDIAIVADSGAGISVFNVFNGMDPTIIAQVDTPGSARRVAVSGDLVAVADGGSGLAVIDISDPPEAAILYQLEFGAGTSVRTVAAQAGLGYFGFSEGFIMLVNLATGEVLSILQLPEAAEDLVFAGDYLYTLSAHTLSTIDYQTGGLRLLGSVDSPIFIERANSRLFAGGGLAYAVHGSGYNVFSLENPAQPVLLIAGDTPQRGWHDLVLNGSDLGVAAATGAFGGPGDVQLYDVHEATETNAFLTQFITPGAAGALTLFNGLAYIADGGSGMQVVNYLAYDNQGATPTLTFDANFSLDPGEAEEKTIARITALATDDVQIRNVEFFIDGEKVLTDGAFPFEHRFITPALVDQASFTLMARASDTGGNRIESEEFLIQLLPDMTGPSVIRFQPRGGGPVVDAVTVTFSEPIDENTLSDANFQLIREGAFAFSSAKGPTQITGGSFALDDEGVVATLSFDPPLADGRYRTVIGTGITDVSANPLVEEASYTFIVTDAVYWVGVSGAWNLGGNWNIGAPPSATDSVIADVPEEVTLIHAGGDNSLARFYSNEAFTHSAGSLTVTDTIQVNNTFRIGPASINQQPILLNATVLPGAGGEGVTLTPSVTNSFESSRFGNVTMNADLHFQNSSLAQVNINGGLTLNGDAFLNAPNNSNNAARMFFDDNGENVLDGSGTVVCNSNSVFGSNDISTRGFLNIGPQITIRGAKGSVRLGSGGLMEGTVDSDSDGIITISGENWVNEGILRASGLGTLELSSGWTNNGALILDGTQATVSLGGDFTPADIGNFEHNSGGTVRISGTVDTTTDTLILDGDSVSWILAGGTLLGGTVEMRGGASLSMERSGSGGTLNGATLNGDLIIGDIRLLTVRNDLTLNGTITLFGGTGSLGAALRFDGGTHHVFDGTGTIRFGNGNENDLLLRSGNDSLEIGPGVTIVGGQGDIGRGDSELINKGWINSGGGRIRIFSAPWTNEGKVRTSGNGRLEISAAWVNTGITEIGANSSFISSSSYTQSATGTLSLNIAGVAPGDVATLEIGGGADLDGTLEINLVSGFVPSVSDTFTLLTFGSRVGTFTTENLPDPGAGKDWLVRYNDSDVNLEVVAE